MAQHFHSWFCTTEKLLQESIWGQVGRCSWGIIDQRWMMDELSRVTAKATPAAVLAALKPVQSGSDFIEMPRGIHNLWQDPS